MTLNEEQERVRRAMQATFGEIKEIPGLHQRVVENKEEKPMKMKYSVVIALAVLLVCGIALAAVIAPSIKDVLPWYVNEEKIVKPISQTHNSKWLDVEITEVYFSEHGLHLMVKMSPTDENKLIVSDFDFKDKSPYRTIMSSTIEQSGEIHIDEWRQGKEVILVEYLDIKRDKGWHSASRVENTLYMDVSSESMLMREDQLEAGITFDVYGCVTNLQTGEEERFTIVVELPPMEMQDAPWNNP